MLLVVTLIILTIQASGQTQVPPELISVPLDDISTINTEHSGQIIAGNDQGKLIALNHQGQVKILEQVHQTKIILIERVRPQYTSEYVTVDASGLVVIWNEDLSEVQNQNRLLPEGESKVAAIAFRQDGGRRAKVRKGFIAITDGSKVIEYNLNERKVNREINAEQGSNIVSLTYLEKYLIASIEGKGLYLAHQESTNFKLLAASELPISMLNNHEEDHGKKDDAVAVQGTNSIIHFNKRGIQPIKIQNNREAAITSLSECKSRGKREKEDLIVVGYSDGTLQVRNYNQILEHHTSNAAIDTIVCEGDSIFYVDQEDNIVKIQIDHLFHTRTQSSGLTTFSFLIVVVTIIAYLANKDKDAKQKKKEEVRKHYEIELQENIVYEPPKA